MTNAFPLAVLTFDAAQAWRLELLRRKMGTRGLSPGVDARFALAELPEAPTMTAGRARAGL